eukprot:CAMPEP_0168375694 /NCGR_PEP_ID=MMETSP0228-20121227/9941_1 /TAXON_ID=133427 /ORGANISM="Protoceratium reticulatum, Strain CCCM 535 (=CCMP 1889)" /LENGTH=360 /DNA_ID=CAMNT_0008388665 /DNA_START=1 /DNA_END=1079 /DNA_ORIENTATION=+
MARGAAVLALGLLPGLCAGLPAEIRGLVATSPAQRSVTTARTPALGDLRKKFTGLPASCEVLVAVNASSVNPADMATPGPFPQVMGSDLAGTVVAVEEGCRRLRAGDLVWADIGAVTRMGQAKGKENGAYGQVAAALESQLGPLPRNLGMLEAASLPKVALTSYKALVWYGGAPFAEANGTVLILGGSGGCGTAGVQLAKALGASNVITTTSAANVDYVRQLGADRVIDYHEQNWWEVLADNSIDTIYDTVGQAGTGDRAMGKLKAGGHYVTIVGALPSRPRKDVESTMFINSNTNLDNVELLEKLRGFAESGKLRMPQLKPYPLEAILDAFAESKTGHVRGKLVVELPPLELEAQADAG